MGEQTFIVRANGKSPKYAFDQAVAMAQCESGIGGYSGTIAEKHNFVFIGQADPKRVMDLINEKMDTDYSDK